MATVDEEREELNLDRFNSIITEYSTSFKNPPKNARQLVQFRCIFLHFIHLKMQSGH